MGNTYYTPEELMALEEEEAGIEMEKMEAGLADGEVEYSDEEVLEDRKLLREANNKKHQKNQIDVGELELVEGVDHKARFAQFQAMKGSLARTAQEKKEKTGVAIDLPTPDEVETVTKQKHAPSAKSIKKLKKPASKNRRKGIQKKSKVIRKELTKDRKTLFEEHPNRTDWKASDIVDMSKMHPTLRRVYVMFFREVRSRTPGMTYVGAKGSLRRMGHPMRYKKRMAEMFLPRI